MSLLAKTEVTSTKLPKFSRKPLYLLSCAVACASFSGISTADVFQEAFVNGKVNASFRMRFEDSEQGDVDADALTLKSRLTFTSGEINKTNVVLEFDDVTSLSTVDYNDATNKKPGPAIPDPEGTEVNQAFVSFKAIDNVDVRYGRQRILLDNQRFVGGVGFRQNEQTYDAFSVKAKPVEDMEAFYAYVTNVNRIFGEAVENGDLKSETHLLNLSVSGTPVGKITGYAYLLDMEGTPGLSSDTYGMRLTNKLKAGDIPTGYTVEYAMQSNGGDNETDYDADYTLVEGFVKVASIKFTLGHEILGSDEGDAAFTTPLATGHKFQGWTDHFLATPAAGVEDTYFSAGTMLSGVKLLAVYHSLSPNEGDGDFGTELGFVVAKKFSKKYGLNLKYADFSADDDSSYADRTKLWLTATAKF